MDVNDRRDAVTVDDPVVAGARFSPGATTGSQRMWAVVLAGAASFLVTLDLLIVTTALDTMRRDLGASLSTLQWVLTAYSVTFACLLLTGAALGDRFGRRRMFAVGVSVFVIGSAWCALSDSVSMLIAGRVVEGVGAALVLPLGLTIVSAAFPPERRGSAIGVLEAVTGLAVIAGPLLGGAIASNLDWQWIFWINVPIGLVIVPLSRAVLDESRGPDSTLDGWGLVLATTGAFGLVWAMVRGNEAGWSSPQVVVAFLIGGAASVAFVVWERRAPAPMLPMRFFASRRFSAGLGSAFLLTATIYTLVFFAAQFFQIAGGHGPMAAGLRLLPWTATLLVVAPIAGALADRIGERPIMVAGLTMQAIGVAWLVAVVSEDVAYAAVLGPIIVAGIGASMAIPVAQIAVVGAVHENEVGQAAGANNMFQELGGAFGLALSIAVFAAAGSDTSPVEFVDGLRPALVVTVVIAVIGAVVAALVPRRARPKAGS